MRIACVITGGLIVLAAGHLGAEQKLPHLFDVGQSIEVIIADQYAAKGISVQHGRLELSGRLVAQDETTLTVTSLDGTETVRYPAAGAFLAGNSVALDGDWLTLDLDDGRPHVRVPLTAIVESDVLGVARKPEEHLSAEQRPAPIPLAVGQDVEVTIAEEYRAEGISVGGSELSLAGRLAGRDERTLTVMSPDGTQTLRYPAAGAFLSGTVVALDDDWLTLDLGDGRPSVHVPLAAILESKVAGSPQEADGAVRRGARVRLESSDLGAQSVVGRVLEVDDESLVLRLPDRLEPLHLQRSSIRRMEVFLGKRNGAKSGATIGAALVGVLGMGFGYLVGSFSNFDCEGSCDSLAPYKGVVMFGAIGAGTGGLVGYLIGSAVETERWQAVPSKRISVSVAPRRRGGLAASLSFSF